MSAPDPLTRALLPVLIHKLGNATQLLTGLNAMLAIDGGEELFEKHTPDLSRCALSLNELGWALATLGTAAGGELLMDRRDPKGLKTLVDLVCDHSRRQPGGRIHPPSCPPLLTNEALSGWEVPWAICSLLLAGGSDCTEESLQWSLALTDSGQWELCLPAGDAVQASAPSILTKIPGAEWALDAGSGVLSMPGPWLRSENA